jgi:hypothetical protein
MTLIERLRFGGNLKSEATRHEAADRIEQLEAALRQEPIAWRERDGDEWCYYDSDHVEAKHLDKSMLEPLYARATLNQNLPPKENAAGWHIEPKRQENDDVFKGFRGNNEA